MPKNQQVSKLFSLKEWLTLDDAARHLSLLFSEDVTTADVLRLALDKRLKLSVDFVNHATVRRGRLVPLKQCPLSIVPKDLLKSAAPLNITAGLSHGDLPNLPSDMQDRLRDGELLLVPHAIRYREDEFLLLDKKIESISGVWDLPMLGSEELDVLHLYQSLTGGPEITLTNLEGAFVERGDVVCQLQESWEDNEFSTGSRAQGKKIEERIATGEIPAERAEELRLGCAEQRKQFLEKWKSKSHEERHYPAGKLPNDSVYVVRTSALREFEEAVLRIAGESEKPMSRREETTLLNIVGGLLSLLLGKTPAGIPQSVFKNQAAVIEALLATHVANPGISERTLEDKFAAAKRSLNAS